MPFTPPSTALPAVTYARPRARPAPAPAVGAAGAAPPAAAAAAPRTAPPPALFDTLLDALRSERKLVEDLAATMRRQRAAVAGDDLETVDDTVFATHRVLATLGQARIRRRQLNRLFAGADELPVRALADAACAAADPGRAALVRGACDELLAGAGALAREVDVNRRVLRDALAVGDQQARALGGLAPAGAFGAPAGADALVDRTA
jgi:transcriptional regulator of met regulon